MGDLKNFSYGDLLIQWRDSSGSLMFQFLSRQADFFFPLLYSRRFMRGPRTDMKLSLRFALLFAAASFPAFRAVSAQEKPIAIVHARMIDGLGGAPLEDATI